MHSLCQYLGILDLLDIFSSKSFFQLGLQQLAQLSTAPMLFNFSDQKVINARRDECVRHGSE
jgi:hypothetical protein